MDGWHGSRVLLWCSTSTDFLHVILDSPRSEWDDSHFIDGEVEALKRSKFKVTQHRRDRNRDLAVVSGIPPT